MKRIIPCILAALVFTSCNKFGDMNTDPTKSSDLDPAIELAYTQQKFSGDVSTNEAMGLLLAMPLAQHFGGGWANQYGQFYQRQQAYLANLWQNNYPNEIKNIVDAEIRSRNTPNEYLNAMTRVMKTYLFARITDLYGDVPYSEAAEGFIEANSTPSYDTQEEIYKDFFAQLDTAITLFNKGKDLQRNDIFYKGDVNKCKKFTSSFRLRLALRIAKRDPDKAKAEIQKAFTDGVMRSNDDICMTKHDNNFNNYATYTGNGMSSALRQGGFPGGYRLHNSFVAQLRNTNDPRLNVIAKNYWDDQPGAGWDNRLDITEQVRAQVGAFGVGPKDFIWEDWKNTITITHPTAGAIAVGNNLQKAQLASYMMANNAPFFHLTYAETEFLLADATLRLGMTLGVSALDHYENGIRAASKQLSLYPGVPVIADTDIETFITNNQFQPGRELEEINTQLWINYFLNGPEAYANIRRTGFPLLPSGYRTDGYSDGDTPVMPRRFEYPLTEKTLNKVKVEEAIQRMGSDNWNNRGIPVLLSIYGRLTPVDGGALYGSDDMGPAIRDVTKRTALVQQLKEYITAVKMDGVNIIMTDFNGAADYSANLAALGPLVNELKAALPANSIVTVTVTTGWQHWEYPGLTNVDWVNVHAYEDGGHVEPGAPVGQASSLAYMKSAADIWKNFHLPASKIVVVFPVFGLRSNALDANGIYYNCIPLIEQKAGYIKTSDFKGMYGWFIDADATDTTKSLFRAAHLKLK